MIKYIIRRLLVTIPVIICVAVLVFTLLYLTPGDPALKILGSNVSEEALAEYRTYLGVDRPYSEQLAHFLRRLFIEFDLGESWVYGTNISTEIANRMPRTIGICIYSVLASAFLGVPLGVMAAVKQDSIFDRAVLFISSFMHCIPNYVYALCLIVLFAVKLKWLPPYGIGGIEFYILPCAAILISSFAGISRQMRSGMLEVIRSDFISAANAQGYPKWNVYFFHAMPNALIPIVTILGTQFAAGLGGTMILETIFSISGMGLYVQGAISKNDLPAIMGTVVFLAILFCLIMLCVDIVYAFLDPRIKAQYISQVKHRNITALANAFMKRRKK